jgi:uncharacterized protein YqgV (UPF0045/DUF77 family)
MNNPLFTASSSASANGPFTADFQVLADLSVTGIGGPLGPKQAEYIRVCEEELQSANLRYAINALSTQIEGNLASIQSCIPRILHRLHVQKAVPKVELHLRLKSKNY